MKLRAKKFEFDYYAKDYSYGMENPIKKLLVKKPQEFFELKVKWLLDYLKRNPLNSQDRSQPIKLLDFGCGTGLFLKILAKYNLGWQLAGCDVSAEMLKQAQTILGQNYAHHLYLLRDTSINLPRNSYDLIIANSVFHHIRPEKRVKIFQELHSILKPSGYLIIFEHNPINPVARLVVKKTDIDRNAVLIYPQEIIKDFKSSKINFISLSYIMFFPPRFKNKFLNFIERKIAFLPLGGQYVVVGKK